ncbi:hypothetical protein [Streptomyces sp. NBC_01497]|uniref:hypothetical protein n=1 Tax=Streptomyces sp. NBC_01497 TaxID=2903885 RepID=UPI002E354407|nr:hypothetical protein [Streptomyces sp. NBC_01497]
MLTPESPRPPRTPRPRLSDDGGQTPPAVPSARFSELPRRIRPEEMVEEVPAAPPNDPEMGRNAENDWMVRYSA